jgi:hypothetical protein
MKDELKAGIVISLLRIEIWEIQGLAMLKHLKIALHVSNSSNQNRGERGPVWSQCGGFGGVRSISSH